MGRHFVLGHCLANGGKLTPNIGICFVSVFAAFNVLQAGNRRVADISRYIGPTTVYRLVVGYNQVSGFTSYLYRFTGKIHPWHAIGQYLMSLLFKIIFKKAL